MARWLASLLTYALGARAIINEQDFAEEDTTHTDVVILGAGASGTYAAVRLREDYKLSVIVIEADDHIGGHVNTYIDPDTKQPVDYGVLSYWDYGPAKDFFARLGVETAPTPVDTSTTVYLDHTTAKNLSEYHAPGFPDILKSIAIYGIESQKYDDILPPGYWNFPSGDAIPEDLLLPYGGFSEKYELDNMYPLLQVIAGTGVGGVRDISTLYVMGFAFGNPATQGLLEPTPFVPKSGLNSELYDKAYDILKDDILLNTTITQAERDNAGVRLVVRYSDGRDFLIRAEHLLVTAAPSIRNLDSIDLDDQESADFSSATPRPLHVGLIKTSAIPRNFSVQFISPLAVPDNYLDLYQDLDYDLKIQSTGPENLQLFRVLLETTYEMTRDDAKVLITDHLHKLETAGTFDTIKQDSDSSELELEFVAMASHDSIIWRLPADEIEAGVIQNLYALQGHRSTRGIPAVSCRRTSRATYALLQTLCLRE